MKQMLTAVFIALGFYVLSLLLFTQTQSILIGLVAFLVTLWTNEALPLGVVSLLPLILFPMFGLVEFKALSANYAKPIIFLFLGGFMLAIGLQKIGLHRVIAIKLLNVFPKTPRGIIYALMITSALLSAFLSNTTITLMLMPISLFLTENTKLKVRFLLATAYGASIGGIMTPIGTAPNLLLLGFLEDLHIATPNFLEWMALTSPVVIAMLVMVPYILSHGVGKEDIGYHDSHVRALNTQDKKMFTLLGLLVSMLLLNPFFHLNEKIILMGFGLLLFMPGIDILRWEDSKDIPYEIIFLFGAGFSIASAFIQTNLAHDMAALLLKMGDLPLFLMLFLVALFVSFSTEITSNTALTSIALPIFYEYATMSGVSVELVLFTATIAASYAFMLPIATPPNAIVMSSGVIKIKQMASIGFWVDILGVAVLSLVAYFYWAKVF
ncbi:MAG: anion transporter [Desulfocapsa sp.]|nr:MAG: anion transporter [Desulfocapsa sp.]